MLNHQLQSHFVINTVLSIFILAMLIDYRNYLIILITGTTLGIVFYVLLSDGIISFDQDALLNIVYLYLFTAALALSFTYRRDQIIAQVVDLELKDRQVLERQVEQRTKELQQALAVKAEFLNNISHEVRTPIHGIAAISVGVLDKWDHYDETQRHQFVAKIANSANRIKSLVNNILDVSKINSGQMNYEFEEACLSILTSEMIEESKNLYLHHKGLSIKFLNNIGKCKIDIDKDRMNQVLRNLFSNAIKYSYNNSCIYVTLDVFEEDNVILSIQNTGPSIPDDEINSIFEAFFQSSSTKTGAGGTGLGLSICQDIIHKHSGQIWVENTSDGAKFCFTLPKINKIHKPILLRQNTMQQSSFKKPNIIFIDDD
ncbi:MAG: HAMP domain-containing sensor histidine kinase, partial [Pseudomonadota bacterium]